MKSMRILFVLFLLVGGLGLTACSDDDDNPTGPGGGSDPDPWVGEWFMEGDNVPSILTDFLNIKNVAVTMRDDQTITTVETDSTDAVTTRQGTYAVTLSSSGSIHAVSINYNDGLAQEGILEVVEGTPNVLKLELVPVGGTTPPATPATGFGTTAPNEANVQRYVPVEDPGNAVDEWVGDWFMEGDNVPSILTDFLNIKNVAVTMRDDQTITTVETDSTDAVTTRQGTYAVTLSSSGSIHAVAINYNDGLAQEGILEVVEGTPDVLKLELVPTGGTVPPATPATGFGTTAPNEGNVQRYERQ